MTALTADGKCRSLNLEPEERGSLLGNIYIGKVQNVVKNINAAFIDLGGGKMGYYSLTENRDHLFADSTSAPCPGRKIKQGDELVVQVARDAVKTKDPVLSCYLNFTGKYAVLTMGKPQIGFSTRIRDERWKSEVREYVGGLKDERFGLIIRTNAMDVPKETIGREVLELRERMDSLLIKASCRLCFSVLESTEPSYILGLRDTYAGTLEAILTDQPDCYGRMKEYLDASQPGDACKLKLYEDAGLPLIKLYSLESAMEEALGRRVWLKSGGYLVIEPTEALTVVDVNTGKYTGKKNVDDTILKINLEAACETARQICLRNLSGIIIVDFIDMTKEEHRRLLLERLEEELKKDSVKTVLVDMTKLGLVEITRKKVRKPFHEMMRESAAAAAVGKS